MTEGTGILRKVDYELTIEALIAAGVHPDQLRFVVDAVKKMAGESEIRKLDTQVVLVFRGGHLKYVNYKGGMRIPQRK